MKSALRGSQGAAPASSHSAAPTTKSATKSALRGSHCEALTRRFATRALPKTRSRYQNAAFAQDFPLFLETTHESKTHGSSHLSRNLGTSKITTTSKVLRLPRNLHFEAKPLRSLAPATKSDHHVRKCARRHNESAVATSGRCGQPVLRACAIEVHFEDFERHET